MLVMSLAFSRDPPIPTFAPHRTNVYTEEVSSLGMTVQD